MEIEREFVLGPCSELASLSDFESDGLGADDDVFSAFDNFGLSPSEE